MAHSEALIHAKKTLSEYKKSPIGKGGQGEVYKLTSAGKVFAVKVLEWKEDQSNRLSIVQESFITLHAKNHNVLKAHEIFTYDEGVAIVMPYFPHGDLGNIAPQLNIFQLKEAIRQITYGLQYFHGERQIHRDIKPKNVLVRNIEPLEVLIADFGCASITNPITVVGTEGYQAPEIHQQKERAMPIPYTNAVDIYALGVLLLECLSVHLDPVPIFNKKLYGQIVGSTIDQAMEQCDDIERRGALMLAGVLTSFKAELRPSADEVLKAAWLNPWFYIPFFATAGISVKGKSLPSLEPESRPINNPLIAIALNVALEYYVRPEPDHTGYLAYTLARYFGPDHEYNPLGDSTHAESIPDILQRLLPSLQPVSMPKALQQRDRIPYCVGQHVQKLGHPSNRGLLIALADSLDHQMDYSSTNARTGRVGVPSPPGQRTPTRATSTKFRRRRPSNRRVLREINKGAVLKDAQDPSSSAMQVQNTSSTPQRESQGIRTRLRSNKALNSVDQKMEDITVVSPESIHRPTANRRSAKNRSNSDRMDLHSG